jgi:SAM-dependent methyltransferase
MSQADSELLAYPLSANDAQVFETFVVPRYLAMFGELLASLVIEGADAQIIHVNCRTGYPDRTLAARLPNSHVYGCDPSPAALDLARSKASAKQGMVYEYRVAESIPIPFPDGAFSHGLTLHTRPEPEQRARILSELARLIAPRGQVLLATPLRGSFQEIADLVREYALKFEAAAVANAVEASTQMRPTEEVLRAEVEKAGFDFVEVEARPRSLKFKSGRDFMDDPVVRLVLLPEMRRTFGMGTGEKIFGYVRDAIDKYWSKSTFELSVQVGVVTGRRLE